MIQTPYFLIDEEKIASNLAILDRVQRESGAKVLLAQKAFSTYQLYPLIAGVLAGTTSSGLYEARLADEEFHPAGVKRHSFAPWEDLTPGAPAEVPHDREIHVYEPAYTHAEMEELVHTADHIVFNSLYELETYRPLWERVRRDAGPHDTPLHIGLRLNPEYSTQEGHAIYDPCASGSRLGIRKETLDAYGSLPAGVDGLHFHTLCEQGFEPLEQTWQAVEERFGKYLADPAVTWVNLGGGHHITKQGYDVEGLIALVRSIRERYGVTVYLEPGEAVVLDAGSLVSTVLDIVETDGLPVLILDTSAECHMPDVLEMPYTPPVRGAEAVGEMVPAPQAADESAAGTALQAVQHVEPAYRGEAGVEAHTGAGQRTAGESDAGGFVCRLSSRTCLAGDVIGDYRFPREVRRGDRIEFLDMALYTMVKTNTFNGMMLPSIAVRHRDGQEEVLKTFGYRDFKKRL